MDERVRWVPKAEAAEELEISLSTLDRKIRRGEVEVAREGRRVYVRMEGPEYVGDDELLRRSLVREERLQRSVWELERDESREAASISKDASEELAKAYRNERAAHWRTRRVALRLGLVAGVLLVLVAVGIPMAWRLFT